MVKIFFIFLLIIKINGEIFKLDNLELTSNSVTNYKRFVYSNNSIHNSFEQSGFNYQLLLNYTNNKAENESFHIYVIKSDILPNSDLLNNPAICCSDDGGIICDDNGNKTPLKNYSLYFKDVTLDKAANYISIKDNKTFYAEGVYYTLFLICTHDLNNTETYDDYSKSLGLYGYFTFYNSYGYLSADDFYTIDLYMFLIMYYFIVSMYWTYLMIIRHSFIQIYNKAFSFVIPSVLLEKIMNLQFYNELNKTGEINTPFEILVIVFHIIKNLILIIIFYALSLGYGYNIHFNISKKKIVNMIILLIGYIFSLAFYNISFISYTHHNSSMAYIILSLLFMSLTFVYILYKIYKGFNKQIKFAKIQNADNVYNFYRSYMKVFKFCFYTAFIWIILVIFYKLFSNYDQIWKTKWLLDLVSEIICLVIFTLSVILLKPTIEKDDYVRHIEESINNTKNVELS